MIAKLLIDLEERNGRPQDFEWAFEDGNSFITMCSIGSYSITTGQLYCLQARPIVTLPLSSFFVPDAARGSNAVLWDNSNIVESYSGVTSPLTFSFASRAYEQVNYCRDDVWTSLLCKGHPCVLCHKSRQHCNLPC